jgi:hypothetical protein
MYVAASAVGDAYAGLSLDKLIPLNVEAVGHAHRRGIRVARCPVLVTRILQCEPTAEGIAAKQISTGRGPQGGAAGRLRRLG